MKLDVDSTVAGDLVMQAHQELRDIYVAATTAARAFSLRGKPDASAEAMGLACDATRVRRALDDVAAAGRAVS